MQVYLLCLSILIILQLDGEYEAVREEMSHDDDIVLNVSTQQQQNQLLMPHNTNSDNISPASSINTTASSGSSGIHNVQQSLSKGQQQIHSQVNRIDRTWFVLSYSIHGNCLILQV
jgi:hypothetical protein